VNFFYKDGGVQRAVVSGAVRFAIFGLTISSASLSRTLRITLPIAICLVPRSAIWCSSPVGRTACEQVFDMLGVVPAAGAGTCLTTTGILKRNAASRSAVYKQ
jgi:hypothetical protein